MRIIMSSLFVGICLCCLPVLPGQSRLQERVLRMYDLQLHSPGMDFPAQDLGIQLPAPNTQLQDVALQPAQGQRQVLNLEAFIRESFVGPLRSHLLRRPGRLVDGRQWALHASAEIHTLVDQQLQWRLQHLQRGIAYDCRHVSMPWKYWQKQFAQLSIPWASDSERSTHRFAFLHRDVVGLMLRQFAADKTVHVSAAKDLRGQSGQVLSMNAVRQFTFMAAQDVGPRGDFSKPRQVRYGDTLQLQGQRQPGSKVVFLKFQAARCRLGRVETMAIQPAAGDAVHVERPHVIHDLIRWDGPVSATEVLLIMRTPDTDERGQTRFGMWLVGTSVWSRPAAVPLGTQP